MDSSPEPARYLDLFSPLADWILGTIRVRLSAFGIKLPDLEISPPKYIRSRTSYPNPTDAELDVVKLAVDEVGWLTWNDYLHLVVAWRCRGYESEAALSDWISDGKRWDEYLELIRLLMKHEENLRPFKTVFEKVIERYLLEVEVRKKYNSTVGKRYRDYWSSGRSLDFGWEDIESESKEIGLGRIRNDGELENITERDKEEGLREKDRGGI
jgi:hypothetical protein